MTEGGPPCSGFCSKSGVARAREGSSRNGESIDGRATGAVLPRRRALPQQPSHTRSLAAGGGLAPLSHAACRSNGSTPISLTRGVSSCGATKSLRAMRVSFLLVALVAALAAAPAEAAAKRPEPGSCEGAPTSRPDLPLRAPRRARNLPALAASVRLLLLRLLPPPPPPPPPPSTWASSRTARARPQARVLTDPPNNTHATPHRRTRHNQPTHATSQSASRCSRRSLA